MQVRTECSIESKKKASEDEEDKREKNCSGVDISHHDIFRFFKLSIKND